MMNRRDLLKYFAAGTVIAPVSGAAPLAKLIEVPKLDLIESPLISQPFNLSEVERVTVTLDMKDGSRKTLTIDDIWKWPGDIWEQWIDPTCDLRAELQIMRVSRQSAPTAHLIGRIVGDGKIS